MKVSDLSGQALDYWVARAEGLIDKGLVEWCPYVHGDKAGQRWLNCRFGDRYGTDYNPSVNWEDGGPILERERIGVVPHARQPGMWAVPLPWSDEHESVGPTPLVAAMRAFVARKFGEEVPDAEKVGDGPWVSTTDAFTKPPFVKPRIMGEIVAEVFNKAFERKCARCGAVGAVENDGRHFCVALGDGSLSVRND